MFTSIRGTITEGIDYDGDKLHCCATIGVPLIDTRPKRIEAIEHAYANRISTDDGFNTAIKIPAVRKTRQAIGRVLRGVDEVGVRVLIDERYGSTEWDGAKQFLSPQEQKEFDVINAGEIKERISSFWSDR
jgi:DNA excision repair protein ERCC-2